MGTAEYLAACKREIAAAEAVCGKDASQANLVGHLAGEVVRLRALLHDIRSLRNEGRADLPFAIIERLEAVK